MLPRSEIKLLDVPEMGYLTTDQPPRGELCVKTPAMISGYFKNDQETREKFVDGYFRTGDIVVMEQPNKVRIIDRKKNIFKLAQGEFVSPEQLEVRFIRTSTTLLHFGRKTCLNFSLIQIRRLRLILCITQYLL